MKNHKQSLNQWLTNALCKMLLGILTSVSVQAQAVAPTPQQKVEFGAYIRSVFEDTAHVPSIPGWSDFHRKNSYIRSEIFGYTVPRKSVGNGVSFVAHGIISARASSNVGPSLRIVYRFNGDGSYWVVAASRGTKNPRIFSITEYVKGPALSAKEFIVETVGENALRKWSSKTASGLTAAMSWEALSEPSLQEALDAYDDRVFFSPSGGDPLDIDEGDPSLKPVRLSEIGEEEDKLELVDAEAETALRRTMILNKLVQLRSDPDLYPTYSGLLKTIREEVYNMSPTEVDASYGLLQDILPRGGDYDFPPGCAGD